MMIRTLFLGASMLALTAAAPAQFNQPFLQTAQFDKSVPSSSGDNADQDSSKIDAGLAAARSEATYDRAIQLFSAALAESKLSPADELTAYYNRGIVYLGKTDYPHAIADFTSAVKRSSDLAGAYIGRGLAYEKMGQLDQAIADYGIALQLNPEDSVAYHDRAIAFGRQQNFDRALADLDAALRFDPADAFAYFERGHAHRATGHYEQAIADFDQAIKLVPDETLFYNSRAYANFDAGHFAAASQDFRHSLLLDPAQPYAILWLRLADAKLGHQTSMSPADENQPEGQKWPEAIAQFYAGRMSVADVMAQAEAGDGTERNERDCEALFFRGEFALLQHNSAEALQLLRQAKASCPVTVAPYASATAELARIGS